MFEPESQVRLDRSKLAKSDSGHQCHIAESRFVSTDHPIPPVAEVFIDQRCRGEGFFTAVFAPLRV